MNEQNNLQFLGTCAHDYSPKLQNEFKDSFDKDARRSSAALLNGRFLIDAGDHVLDSLRIAQIDLCSIDSVFITHTHGDHFRVENLTAIAKAKKEPLKLYINENAVIDSIENVEIIKMKPFQKLEVATDLFITGIPANHSPKAFPQHLIIESKGKKIFYGCDGAWFLHDSFKFLKNSALDLAVFDCTVGDYLGDFRMAEHNSIPMLRLMLPSLKKIGAVTENTRLFISHIAPSLHKPHEQICEILKELSITVAFDGMITNI